MLVYTARKNDANLHDAIFGYIYIKPGAKNTLTKMGNNKFGTGTCDFLYLQDSDSHEQLKTSIQSIQKDPITTRATKSYQSA